MPPEPTNMVPFEKDGVRGFLHRPAHGAGQGLVLTHGAGGNCEAPLLVALAGAFCSAGMSVLRCDLPFRQKRRSGPPSPGSAAGDRAGLRTAVEALRPIASAAIYLGGHSYGGRQASMLAAEEPGLVQALLLLSYPLHPPDKPTVLRTAHFPSLRTPALFVQGDADPFASIAELKAAVGMIPAQTRIMTVERAGHDLGRGRVDLPAIVAALLEFGLNQPGVATARLV